MSTTFIERLEELLKQNNISQTELANRLNIRRPTISDWKKNGVLPNTEIALKIAKMFNISVECLINGDDPNGLTVEEMQLLKKFRSLSKTNQAIIQNQIEFTYTLEMAEKKEKISGY